MEIHNGKFTLTKDDQEFLAEMITRRIMPDNFAEITLRNIAKTWYDRGWHDAIISFEDDLK